MSEDSEPNKAKKLAKQPKMFLRKIKTQVKDKLPSYSFKTSKALKS